MREWLLGAGQRKRTHENANVAQRPCRKEWLLSARGALDTTLVAPDVRRLYDSAWKREGTDMLTMEVEQPMRARKAHKRNEHGLANCLKHRMRG